MRFFANIDEAVLAFVYENDKICFNEEQTIIYDKLYRIFKTIYISSQSSYALLDELK